MIMICFNVIGGEIMGLGIIAVGLWLLLGIQFYYNQIFLFPTIVSLMIMFVGICNVLKKVKQKDLMIALILMIIEMMMTLCFNQYHSIILIILLYFLFKGIKELSTHYLKIHRYKKACHIYLLCLIIMELLSYFCKESLTVLTSMILMCSIVILCVIVYYIFQINDLLEDDYLDLEVKSFDFRFKVLIMIILSCVSIGGLIYVKDDFIYQIHQEVNEKESIYFKVDQDDYKLTPFGYRIHKQTRLEGQEEVCSYNGIKLFIKNDFIKYLSKVRYTILCENQVILQSYDVFKKIEYADDGIYYGHEPFEGYTGGYVDNDVYDDIDQLKDHVYDKRALTFKIELYDKKKHCYYKDECAIEKVFPVIYQYEDEDISIKDFQYDMNTLISEPEIKIKNKEVHHMYIYYEDDYKNKDPMILFYVFDEDDQLKCSSLHDLINAPVKDFKSLKIVYYDKDGHIIKETLCLMEVSS